MIHSQPDESSARGLWVDHQTFEVENFPSFEFAGIPSRSESEHFEVHGQN